MTIVFFEFIGAKDIMKWKWGININPIEITPLYCGVFVLRECQIVKNIEIAKNDKSS